MKRFHGVLLSFSAILMACFIAVGYAALTDNLTVTGNISVMGKPFKGVYIKSVEVMNTSSATSLDCDFILPTNHKATVDALQSGGSVTYKITVHNNTDITYWYIGPQCTNDYGSNSLVGVSNGVGIITKDQHNDNYQSFNSEDWVPPQTERVFFVTYTYGANALAECQTMINFHFDIRMDGVHDEFLAVLNNVKSPTSYQELKSAFETEYSHTGSVSISTESHPELFASLFDDLIVNIDGIERQASIVIRRENLDQDTSTGDSYNGGSPSGCEYTLYITVEPLTPGTRPTVYAIAYSEGADGMGNAWYQVGELYEGTASIDVNGNIDYSSWIATHKTYEMADGISYIVGAPNGDQYDIMKTMEQLISAEDQDIFNQIDNTNIFKKVYDILNKHYSSTDPAVQGLRDAFYSADKFYNNFNNGQEFKVVRNKYTRAEIIDAIQTIQMALDYYYQAFPG